MGEQVFKYRKLPSSAPGFSEYKAHEDVQSVDYSYRQDVDG